MIYIIFIYISIYIHICIYKWTSFYVIKFFLYEMYYKNVERIKGSCYVGLLPKCGEVSTVGETRNDDDI